MHGGYLPQLAALENKTTIFTRRNGAAFSLLWCLFFLLIMTPMWGIMNIDELAAASAVLGIFGGLMLLISSLIFLKKAPGTTTQPNLQQMGPPPGLYGQPQYGALPHAQSIPASSYGAPQPGNWRDTNDLQTPVSEGATKLLNEDER